MEMFLNILEIQFDVLDLFYLIYENTSVFSELNAIPTIEEANFSASIFELQTLHFQNSVFDFW